MPKLHKIKRYHRSDNVYKAKPHPVTILLWVLGLAVLVFVGISIYQPLYNLIMGKSSFFGGQSESSAPSSSSSLPTPSQDDESQPEDPVVSSVSGLRAVYLPPSIASESAALDRFLDSLDGSEVNAVMVDLKDKTGAVLYSTTNQNAIDWGAVASSPLDLTALVEKLSQRNLQLVARISAFCDQKAANGNRDNAIHYQDGEWLWLDNAANAGGKAWLNPFAAGARRYITDLAVEATQVGAALVILEDVQFPDGSGSPNATFGTAAGSDQRLSALREFVEESTTAVQQAGGRLGLYFPAAAIATAEGDKALSTEALVAQSQVRYGGSPLDLAADTLVLGLLPYQFGNGYSQGGLELTRPMEDPAATVTTVLDYVQKLIGDGQVNILPLLQGDNEPAYNTAPYTKEQLNAQTEAAQQLGCESYILYSTAGTYPLQ